MKTLYSGDLSPYSAKVRMQIYAKGITDIQLRRLSRLLRDYLYIPLGGNRGGNLKTMRNLCIVFFLCGLWHGAAWNRRSTVAS